MRRLARRLFSVCSAVSHHSIGDGGQYADEFARVLCAWGMATFNALVALDRRRRGWSGPPRHADEYWCGGTYRAAGPPPPAVP